MFDMEEIADEAIKDMRSSINVEKQLIEEEHDFELKLSQWDVVIGHLDESTPMNLKNVHKLNGKIVDKIIELKELVEMYQLYGLRIVKEEKEILKKLENVHDLKEWKLVKIDLESEGKKLLRMEKEEIKEMHSIIIDIMKLMKRSNLISTLKDDLTVKTEKKDFIRKVNYYYTEIYKFLRTYEKILRNLWSKERHLVKHGFV